MCLLNNQKSEEKKILKKKKKRKTLESTIYLYACQAFDTRRIAMLHRPHTRQPRRLKH